MVLPLLVSVFSACFQQFIACGHLPAWYNLMAGLSLGFLAQYTVLGGGGERGGRSSVGAWYTTALERMFASGSSLLLGLGSFGLVMGAFLRVVR